MLQDHENTKCSPMTIATWHKYREFNVTKWVAHPIWVQYPWSHVERQKRLSTTSHLTQRVVVYQVRTMTMNQCTKCQAILKAAKKNNKDTAFVHNPKPNMHKHSTNMIRWQTDYKRKMRFYPTDLPGVEILYVNIFVWRCFSLTP